MSKDSKCPVTGGVDKTTASRGTPNQHWRPNLLNLKILHQNSSMGKRGAHPSRSADADADRT